MALEVDERSLIDSFLYHQYKGMDIYSKHEYDEPLTIKNVRIDRSAVYAIVSNENKLIASSIIFCYASATQPFIHFKEQSKVEFDGKEYIITKVILNKEPKADKVWSYELEVI